jgi:hypothetical protein
VRFLGGVVVRTSRFRVAYLSKIFGRYVPMIISTDIPRKYTFATRRNLPANMRVKQDKRKPEP